MACIKPGCRRFCSLSVFSAVEKKSGEEELDSLKMKMKEKIMGVAFTSDSGWYVLAGDEFNANSKKVILGRTYCIRRCAISSGSSEEQKRKNHLLTQSTHLLTLKMKKVTCWRKILHGGF